MSFKGSMSLHLRDPLDVVSDPGFWVPSNCSSPETLALLLSCAQPDKHKIFMQNFLLRNVFLLGLHFSFEVEKNTKKISKPI